MSINTRDFTNQAKVLGALNRASTLNLSIFSSLEYSEIRESSRFFLLVRSQHALRDHTTFGKDLSLSLQYAIDHAKKLRNLNAD